MHSLLPYAHTAQRQSNTMLIKMFELRAYCRTRRCRRPLPAIISLATGNDATTRRCQDEMNYAMRSLGARCHEREPRMSSRSTSTSLLAEYYYGRHESMISAMPRVVGSKAFKMGTICVKAGSAAFLAAPKMIAFAIIADFAARAQVYWTCQPFFESRQR